MADFDRTGKRSLVRLEFSTPQPNNNEFVPRDVAQNCLKEPRAADSMLGPRESEAVSGREKITSGRRNETEKAPLYFFAAGAAVAVRFKTTLSVPMSLPMVTGL